MIVCGDENTEESNWMMVPSVLGLASAFVRKMTYGSVPEVPEPENPAAGRVDRINADQRRDQVGQLE